MEVKVTSTLLQPVEHRASLDGEATLMFVLKAEGADWAVEARVKLGKDADHFLAAERIAGMCQRGDEITVVADGMMGRSDHSTLAIILRNVRSVEVRGAYGCYVIPKPPRIPEGKLL